MKRTLQLLALLVATIALVGWYATGANRGWTKTSVEVITVDEITGIEGREYQKAFIPGIEVLGCALLGAAALAGTSFFVGSKTHTNKNEK